MEEKKWFAWSQESGIIPDSFEKVRVTQDMLGDFHKILEPLEGFRNNTGHRVCLGTSSRGFRDSVSPIPVGVGEVIIPIRRGDGYDFGGYWVSQ